MREREYGKNVNEQMAFEKDIRGTSGKVEGFSETRGKVRAGDILSVP